MGMDFPSWINTPGKWVEQFVIPPGWDLPMPKGAIDAIFSTPFLAQSGPWHRPTCVRYFNPQLLKDGRAIAAAVEEEGTPGEPGWIWRFYVTENITGPVEWRVETRGCDVS